MSEVKTTKALDKATKELGRVKKIENHWLDQREDAIKDLYGHYGWSMARIGKRMGVSRQRVFHIVKEK